eukprot:COSAG06_NODE_769_length_12440_cov_7.241796_8_plen_43_part_00
MWKLKQNAFGFVQKPNQFELISLLIDSPVSEVRKRRFRAILN